MGTGHHHTWCVLTQRIIEKEFALAGEPQIDAAALEAENVARDREVADPYAKDLQITAIHGARASWPTA